MIAYVLCRQCHDHRVLAAFNSSSWPFSNFRNLNCSKIPWTWATPVCYVLGPFERDASNLTTSQSITYFLTYLFHNISKPLKFSIPWTAESHGIWVGHMDCLALVLNAPQQDGPPPICPEPIAAVIDINLLWCIQSLWNKCMVTSWWLVSFYIRLTCWWFAVCLSLATARCSLMSYCFPFPYNKNRIRQIQWCNIYSLLEVRNLLENK